jgi:hypothetical protein
MSTLNDMLSNGLTKVTKEFVKQKRIAAAQRRDSLSFSQISRLRRQAAQDELKQQLKNAAWQIMEQAYLLTSDNGRLPANARQIMYAARPLVMKITDGKCWEKSSYFTQVLLPDYISEHPDITVDWDVVYDARGHFVEPHVLRQLGIGTLEVRGYINSWNNDVAQQLIIEIDTLYPTHGPRNRYEFALFIEKEGFTPLIERARIAQRYDLAIFSSKGMSTTATRLLVERLSDAGVTILVAHDFDLAGLTICHTLSHDTRRYSFATEPNVIDIGLRLEDVNQMGLQSEPVLIKQKKDPREKFDELYVPDEELNFLVEQPVRNTWDGTMAWQGKRVELNAMTSRQLLDWLEGKLADQGVKKVIPTPDTLRAAYRRAQRIAKIQQLIDEAPKPEDDSIEIPQDLAERLRKLLKANPALSWDEALVRIQIEE